MSECAACGRTKGAMIGMGGTTICRKCAPDIEAEIKQLHGEGKPVNVSHIARRIFREAHCAGDYLLRDIPEELWKQAKHRAVDDGDSLRDVILQALRTYLS